MPETQPSARPAHRPSRRENVLDAAVELFARSPVEDITVHDIADQVGMTPAAVYYHFASKEQILTEVLARFRDRLLEELDAATRTDPDWVGGATLRRLLGVVIERREVAMVYFVQSIGLSLLVEALRRETRIEMVSLWRAKIAGGSDMASAEAGMVAVALVSLLETSAASLLNADDTYTVLGSDRFLDEVASLADRILAKW